MSGKGGVGKTALAVNLARIYSEIGDVVLVDMDLQNRGATGVFGSMKLQGPTAEQLLTSDSAKPSPVRVGERLFFVPSALTKLSVDPELRQELHVAQLKERIRVMIEHLTRQLNPILIIMDCHGGIAVESVAAFAVSSQVIVATEPDAVTFAGTLTLISAIENGLVDGEPRPGVRIVVNRIPTRYRWKDLEEIYTGVAADFIGISEALPGVSYIPVEGELFVTFGEYPYQVDLAPNSLFAQKLRLLLFQIVPDTPLEILKKNHSPKKQRRVHEALSTAEAKVTRIVFASFVALAILVLVTLPLAAVQMDKNEVGSLGFIVAGVALVGFGVPSVLFFWFGTVQLARYYVRSTMFHVRCVLQNLRRKASHGVLAMRSAVFAAVSIMAACAPFWWGTVYSTADVDFRPTPDYRVEDADGGSKLVLSIWEEEAMNGALSARSRLAVDGFELIEPIVASEFRDGIMAANVDVNLDGRRRYWLVAGCDTDCVNLSIEFPQLDISVAEGDTPEMDVQLAVGGEYEIVLRVTECRSEPCAVMLARYGQIVGSAE